MEKSMLLTVIVVLLTAAGLTMTLWADGGRFGNAGRWSFVQIQVGVGMFLMMGMLYAGGLQILVRYALSDYMSLFWTEEFSRLLLVWAAFWGSALVQRSDDHLSMTIVFDRLPQRAQLVVRLFGDLVVVGFLAVLVWHGWWAALPLLDVPTITLGLPLAVFPFSVPIGGALMIVYTLRLMLRRIRGESIDHVVTQEA